MLYLNHPKAYKKKIIKIGPAVPIDQTNTCKDVRGTDKYRQGCIQPSGRRYCCDVDEILKSWILIIR